MRTTLVAALLVVLLAITRTAAASAPAEESRKCGVRPLTPDGAALLQDGVRRSSLMRSQLAVLNASNLVVYLAEVFESEAGEPKGKLRFVSAAGGRRYVIITLDRWKLPRNDRLVMLAHELQHAVEVAGAPGVTDLASFRALYCRIGWEVKAGHFETDGARAAAARMRADLDLPLARAAANESAVPESDRESARHSRSRR